MFWFSLRRRAQLK